MQEQENQAMKISEQTAKDAAALAKVTAQAASGNAAGAVITAVQSGLLKRTLCVKQTARLCSNFHSTSQNVFYRAHSAASSMIRIICLRFSSGTDANI